MNLVGQFTQLLAVGPGDDQLTNTQETIMDPKVNFLNFQ